MHHPLLEHHYHSMDFEHKAHFESEDDWTEGVIEKFKGIKALELIFKSKFYLNPKFKECSGIDALKITLNQPGHYSVSWLLNRNMNNTEAHVPFFSQFLPEHLASIRCIESTSLKIADLPNVTPILEKFLQDPHVYIDLVLGDCELKDIPDIVFRQTNLRRLMIVGAPELETISEELGNLTLLHELWINETGLKRLPESLGNLKNLHLLNVSRNQLVDLPHSLAQLTQLNELQIHGNFFSTVPTALEKAYNMQHIISESELINLSESEIEKLVCVSTQLNERLYVRRN